VDPDDAEDGVVVEDGKEDNFYSLSAREYVVEGRARVTPAAGASDKDIKQLVSLKHVAIAWFLNQYLVDKEDDEANASYGGYSAMVKTGDYDDLAIIKLSGGDYEFTFSQTIAGPPNLLGKLPIKNGALTVEFGKPSNADMARLETNHEWYRDAPWSEWDPSKVAADKKESMTLTIKEDRRSVDAWWDYQKLFTDGKLDIDVYFGWDYHDDYHLKHSRQFYNWLVARGFKSPTSSFDGYTRKSGPLTRTIKANGRDVRVEVRIIYGKPGSDTDPDTNAGGKVLEDEMRASVKTRDVVVYSGHSGPFYGFALANWRMTDEGDFDDADMVVADMAEKYQIILAEGCDTYMIGPAFMGNPAKNGSNVDVITTTSFSNASTPAVVERFFTRLLEVDSSGRHRPRTFQSLMSDLDDAAGWGFHTEYGVHGADDDPQLHPYAQKGNFCRVCKVNADCGGVGNSCVTVGHSGKRCAAACTSDTACGTGYACKKVASGSTIYASMCVPSDNVCR
jgi:hypothetical protein